MPTDLPPINNWKVVDELMRTCTCSQFCIANASIWSTTIISIDDKKSAFLHIPLAAIFTRRAKKN